jgi:hypothetical protein
LFFISPWENWFSAASSEIDANTIGESYHIQQDIDSIMVRIKSKRDADMALTKHLSENILFK